MQREHKDYFTVVYSWISNLLHYVVGLVLLVISAVLAFNTAVSVGSMFTTDNMLNAARALLDNILFVIMILEIAHTVLISYREHVIRPEPFLIVGLIAAVRRILVLTISVADLHMEADIFRMAMIETVVIGAQILVLVVAIVLLRRFSRDVKYRLPSSGKPSAGENG